MMIDVRFTRVSKRYRVRRPGPATGSWIRRLARPRALEDFWAVRDVSIDVSRGETLGVIGHNGAGKSTLLKLLSRITAPTTGTITLNGRLAALIELGSGFHPELTGRENVFLSGSLLGMRRREITAKLDRIIAFSGVGSFIDTPVKWYSSGMYVRLGFSIAAHLEPDILLVDEVLAVGDAAFQLQCIERLTEMRRAGTTMLFISHDLHAIEKLCDRVVLMQSGRLISSGAPHDVVETYQHSATAHAAEVADTVPVSGPRPARIDSVGFRDASGAGTAVTRTGAPISTFVRYSASHPVKDAVVEVFYYSRDGRILHCQHSTAVSGGDLALPTGSGEIEFSTPGIGLQPGIYSIGATIRQRSASGAMDWYYGHTLLYVEPGISVRGYFYAPHQWRVTNHSAPADLPGARDAAPVDATREPAPADDARIDHSRSHA